MTVPKDFLTLSDWPAEALLEILARAAELKALWKKGERPQTLASRTLAMYFEHPSLRTHVTFDAGISQLGGHAVFLSPEQVGVGTRETPRDVAQNLSRWVDAMVARTASHALVEDLASAASIPVINGLTDLAHPCQAMADFLTISERVPLSRAVVAYVGDGNNVANSLLDGAAALGVELRMATPETHRPALRVRQEAERRAEKTGARLMWTADPSEAVRGANFVYTDVWTSMGQENEAALRRSLFEAYQLNARLLRHAPDAWVLHCLPAHRGEEITSDVLEGARSIVLDQAENRLHAQKAILERLILPRPA
jgi:ornithine carbamoyltransferase